jgi:hypothetical protein
LRSNRPAQKKHSDDGYKKWLVAAHLSKDNPISIIRKCDTYINYYISNGGLKNDEKILTMQNLSLSKQRTSAFLPKSSSPTDTVTTELHYSPTCEFSIPL